MKHLQCLVLFSLLVLLADAGTASAQVARLNDAKLSSTTPVAKTQSDDDAWHATFDPLVTNLISLDDQIRAMEVKLNDIAKIPDRSSQLLEIASFEKTVLNKEAEALRVGLDVIAKADSFVPTATQTMETREKTVLVIETKLLLIIVRVVQIKSTIIIIKEGRIPPTIPPVPTPTTTVGPAAARSNPRQ
jgi:TolA-binding protein